MSEVGNERWEVVVRDEGVQASIHTELYLDAVECRSSSTGFDGN